MSMIPTSTGAAKALGEVIPEMLGKLDEAERLMRDVDPTVYEARDAGWDNESLRADRKVDEAAAKPTQIEPS